MKLISKSLLMASLMCTSLSAWAGGIATVDFQKALSQVEEGKRTEAELNVLMTQKQGEVQQLQLQLVQSAGLSKKALFLL